MRHLIEIPADLGAVVRRVRRSHGLRQEDLALGAGTGLRFIGELERGKPTVQLAPTLRVLHALGITLAVEDGEVDGPRA
ncbi:MAG TPA: helix-turn-helix domain-containing protein [Conexibacter sp.]